MQVIWQGKNEGGPIGGTDSMDIVIYAGRSSRCMEGKRAGRAGSSGARIFGRNKEGVWWRRGGVGKGCRAEKARTRRKNNGGVHIRIQEGGKRE